MHSLGFYLPSEHKLSQLLRDMFSAGMLSGAEVFLREEVQRQFVFIDFDEAK